MGDDLQRLIEAGLEADRREGGSYGVDDIEPIVRAVLKGLVSLAEESEGRGVDDTSEMVTEVAVRSLVRRILRDA